MTNSCHQTCVASTTSRRGIFRGALSLVGLHSLPVPTALAVGTGIRGLALGALLSASPFAGFACSTTVDYLRPSNYELVKAADAILLAMAVSQGRTCSTRFDVMDSLMGSFTGDTLILEGCSGEPDYVVEPVDETDFRVARGTQHGPCIRGTYEPGQAYLLLLQRRHDVWNVAPYAFSRVNEPVSGQDSPWVQAVARYIEVAELADYKAEQGALHALQAVAKSGTSPGVPIAIAADIQDHFQTVSDFKSHADLLAVYEASDDEMQRNSVLIAWANRGEAEARPIFEALLTSGRTDYPVASYFGNLQEVGTVDRFAEAFLRADKDGSDWWARQSPLGGLLRIADQRHVDTMLRVYADAHGRSERDAIERWFARHPTPVAADALRERVARRYREHPSASFALAASGDEDIVRWAIEYASTSAEDLWIALYVIASSPLPEADTFARGLIASPDERLIALVQGYQRPGNPHRGARLEQILDIPGRPRELDAWLQRTLMDLSDEGSLEGVDELLRRLPANAHCFFEYRYDETCGADWSEP